jgi:hypothetical protein
MPKNVKSRLGRSVSYRPMGERMSGHALEKVNGGGGTTRTMKEYVVNKAHVAAMDFMGSQARGGYYPQCGGIYAVNAEKRTEVVAGPYYGVYWAPKTLVKDGSGKPVNVTKNVGHVEMVLLGLVVNEIKSASVVYLFSYYSPCQECAFKLKTFYNSQEKPHMTVRKLAFSVLYTSVNCQSSGRGVYGSDADAIRALDELAGAGWTTRQWKKHANFESDGFDKKDREFTDLQKVRLQGGGGETGRGVESEIKSCYGTIDDADLLNIVIVGDYVMESSPGNASGNNPGAF